MSSVKQALQRRPDATISGYPEDNSSLARPKPMPPPPVVNGGLFAPPHLAAIPNQQGAYASSSLDNGTSEKNVYQKPQKSGLVMAASIAEGATAYANVVSSQPQEAATFSSKATGDSPDPGKSPMQSISPPPPISPAVCYPAASPPSQAGQGHYAPHQPGQAYYVPQCPTKAPQQQTIHPGNPQQTIVVQQAEPYNYAPLIILIGTALLCWPCIPCACVYFCAEEANREERRRKRQAHHVTVVQS